MLPLFEERKRNKMRRIALLLTVIASLVLLSSCSSNKKQPAAPGPSKPVYTFTKEDTAEVMELARQFMGRLEQKDIRGAVEMLSFLEKGDSIRPLEPLHQRRQAMSLSVVQGVKYDLNRMTLRSNTNNEVKIDITLFEKDPGDPKPNLTSFYLRPVKFEGKWYLTVWDNITNTNEDRNRD
jgi:hypothetical protein